MEIIKEGGSLRELTRRPLLLTQQEERSNMPGGKNRIQEHPKANSNGFRERPDQAGKPPGRKDNTTLIKQVLKAKDLKYEDPDLYLISQLIDILQDPQTRPGVKLSVVNALLDRSQGKPRQTAEIINNTAPAYKEPVLINTQESNAEDFIEICKTFGISYITVENDEHRKMLEQLRET
jgi:hypothetical protein